ncbi:transmembrane protein, putative (macronuclear) [Tetrahymena thermophila SB210]|uniref:Transmembrane protein, putative n=1 Tax=Tetrahymena thermophila (strain SB210) TaxID=312017 RepID=W7X4Y1_TETTS|nr:transmembrane protein, putative [Tetrahymena thermophila SB210]EWS74400.1 transmembrane protein, putative [Tetrahymena thermophila SB210]|eukprot:XP_012653077.1 transmembrane protein, putative [Tetrahymena thermophila SB210]
MQNMIQTNDKMIISIFFTLFLLLQVSQCLQKTIEMNSEDVDYLVELSPTFFKGEIISYKIIINQLLSLDYTFFYLLQDEGSCSQFSTQFWITYNELGINYQEKQEICFENEYKENNFCQTKLFQKYSILIVQIKCLGDQCRARSLILLDKFKYYIQSKTQNIKIQVQKPVLQIKYEMLYEFKTYLLMYSQELKYVFIVQDIKQCSKITKYGVTYYIFEIKKNGCTKLDFTIISYTKNLSLIIDELQNLQHPIYYNQGYQNLETSHIYVIGSCFISYNYQQYKLLSNVYYKVKSPFFYFIQTCEQESNIIYLKIQQDFEVEEYYLEYLYQKKNSLNLSLNKALIDHAICLYLKGQDINISYGSSDKLFDDNKDYSQNLKQAQVDENGNVCINYEENLSLFQYENKYLIAEGAGFVSYKLMRIKISYDNLNQLYGQIYNKIQTSTYPIQLNIFNQQKIKKRLAIRYSDKCKVIEQTENQDISITLDSQADSSDFIYHLEIYYSLSFQEIDYLEDIIFSDVSNRNTVFKQKIESKNKVIKFYLPKEFKENDFIIELFYDFQSLSTILGKISQNVTYFSPILSSNHHLYYIQKQIIEQNWQEDPIVILCMNLTQLSLKRNYFDSKIQIYNFNFERKIQININQFKQNIINVYIDLQQNKIIQTQNKPLIHIQKINQSLDKLTIWLDKNIQINEQSVDIQFCCDTTYINPIQVYYKYLYEQDDQFLNDNILDNYFFKSNLLIYCWGSSQQSEYYRKLQYIYTRIFDQEELSKIYSLDVETAFEAFQFNKKFYNQAIIRGQEICLALYQEDVNFQKQIHLSNESYIQEIEVEMSTYTLLLSNSTNKIIQVILENENSDFIFEQFNCTNGSYIYTQKALLTIYILKNAQDYQKFQQKLKVKAIDQEVQIIYLNKLFKIKSNQWIILSINKMRNYQILQQSNQNEFYIDFWLSNYNLKIEECSQPNLQIFPQIDGVLTKENNVVKNTEFLYLYLKASSNFNAKQFLFMATEYSHINLINQENVTLNQQVFQNYVFESFYQNRIFKIQHQNVLNIQIYFCSQRFQFSQENQITDISFDLQNKLKSINNTYVFLYPEISLNKNQFYDLIQNSLQQQKQICLQIYQNEGNQLNQNATGSILTDERLTQQLKINQAFNIQINSQNNYQNEYVIFEVEKSDTNSYLYLEYQLIEEKPVLFEVRYMQSGYFLHRFYFQSSQEVKVFQLQNVKYIEIYNYEPTTNILLTLILSEKQFSITNIYRNQMSFNTFQEPKLLLLSRLPDQNLIISLQNNQNQITKEQQKMVPHKIDNIFIEDNQVNYELIEVHQNIYFQKIFYFLDVNNKNVSIHIKIKYYSNIQESYGDFNSSAYEYALMSNTFKFKIESTKLINKIIKDIDILGLQNQKIYFFFSTSEHSISQEFTNGFNNIENNQNIVIFKEYLLKLKQIKDSIKYEITTTCFQNIQMQIRKEDDKQFEYFRIYIQINNSTLIAPLSQIFKHQLPSKNIEIQQKILNQLWMILIILILLLILILVFMFKLKLLYRKIKNL